MEGFNKSGQSRRELFVWLFWMCELLFVEGCSVLVFVPGCAATLARATIVGFSHFSRACYSPGGRANFLVSSFEYTYIYIYSVCW